MAMHEGQGLALELLELMQDMSPEQVEKVLSEWKATCIGEETEKWKRVIGFIEDVKNIAFNEEHKSEMVNFKSVPDVTRVAIVN